MIVASLSHSLKQLFPIVVTLEPIVAVVKDVQKLNTCFSIVVTASGITISVNASQDAYLLLVDYQYYTL